MNALQLMQDYAQSMQEKKAIDRQLALFREEELPLLRKKRNELARMAEQAEQVLSAISRPRWRTMIRMYYILGLSQEAVGLELGLGIRQTGRIFRAIRERLRRIEL